MPLPGLLKLVGLCRLFSRHRLFEGVLALRVESELELVGNAAKQRPMIAVEQGSTMAKVRDNLGHAICEHEGHALGFACGFDRDIPWLEPCRAAYPGGSPTIVLLHEVNRGCLLA